MTLTYTLGWDVGAWHCRRSSPSADGLALLSPMGEQVGEVYRGNIAHLILHAATPSAFCEGLFAYCQAPYPASPPTVLLAVDAPLTFPPGLLALLRGKASKAPQAFEQNHTNPYTFRPCERWLTEQGLRPLSAITNQLGSQATKAMHVMARLGLQAQHPGVWTSPDGQLGMMEVYPAAAKPSVLTQQLAAYSPGQPGSDTYDALMCALVGYTYLTQPSLLAPPPTGSPHGEGWIWVPRDALNRS
jgi:predicted nuclease with RNAse H fold